VETLARRDAPFLRWLLIVDNKLNFTLCRNFSASSPGSATTNTSLCQLNKRAALSVFHPYVEKELGYHEQGFIKHISKYLTIKPSESA
jgi:hypothetical protein